MDSDENYIISQAKSVRKFDQLIAKAWIITAKTLYPENFNVQFEAYKEEKATNNFKEAAKCISYLIMKFQNQNQPVELWNEICDLTRALRASDGETSEFRDFFVKMFQHVVCDVQHKILFLIANHGDNSIEHCKLLLLLFKRFPQAVSLHSSRIIEILTREMSLSPQKNQEQLLNEGLSLIYDKIPDLPENFVYGMLIISLEYYVKKIVNENQDNKSAIYDFWKKIFQILTVCGKVLNWKCYLPFNKAWSKDIYWQKLIRFVREDPTLISESKQILFYTVVLFIYSLQEYLFHTQVQTNEGVVEFVLVESFKEVSPNYIPPKLRDKPLEQPPILVTPSCSEETPVEFVTAVNCWHLLNSNEQLQREFSQLLIKLSISHWISKFLLDLAIYYGHKEEAKKILNDIPINNLKHNIRILSLLLIQETLTVQGLEYIIKILMELPPIFGKSIKSLTSPLNQRQLILLPLTQKAIVQYCTRAILGILTFKMYSPNVNDNVLGDLLILTQLEYPKENHVVDYVFSLIKSKGHFSFSLFSNYIIHSDYIEEFMNIWYSRNGEFILEITSPSSVQGNMNTRRIGTRGVDKGMREDFKQIMKRQIMRSNEDIFSIITQFITQESLHLIQNIF